MVKRAGGRLYVYYALINEVQHRDLVEEAYRILEDYEIEIQGSKIPAKFLPFNIVSIDPNNKLVTFQWYIGFWTNEKPTRLYRLTVDISQSRVEFRVEKNFEPNPRWPTNYLHRKEMFVDGLERIAINPYFNGLTLAWDQKSRHDRWVPLPWIPIYVEAPEMDKALELLTDIKEQIRESSIKVIIRVGRELKPRISIKELLR